MAARASAACSLSSVLNRLRIVVADDEPILLRYYERLIPLFGHQVVGVARDGEELIRICHDTAADLVITDLRMPKVSGLTAMQQCDVPFAIVSAEDMLPSFRDQFSDRLIAYLTKPIKRSDIEELLNVATARHMDGLNGSVDPAGRS